VTVDWDEIDYYAARREHMWLLRAEGLTFREIGMRNGVCGERAKQVVSKFGRQVTRAVSGKRVRLIREFMQ
jgi:hypothetical protein